MEQIGKHIWRPQTTKGSHTYLVQAGQNWVLIDTGYPHQAGRLITELETKIRRLDGILLTHHDFDHIGGAARLQKRFGAPVYLHSLDIPFFHGARKKPRGKNAAGLLSRMLAGTPDNVIPLEKVDYPGITWFLMPGHTPGHCIFHFDDVLFTGDLFANPDRPENMWKYHGDFAAAGASLAKAARLDAAVFCPAHGEILRATDTSRILLAHLAAELSASGRGVH